MRFGQNLRPLPIFFFCLPGSNWAFLHAIRVTRRRVGVEAREDPVVNSRIPKKNILTSVFIAGSPRGDDLGVSAVLFAKYGYRAYRVHLNPWIEFMRIVSFEIHISSFALSRANKVVEWRLTPTCHVYENSPRQRVTPVRWPWKMDAHAHVQGHLYLLQGQIPSLTARQKSHNDC